MIVTGVGVPLWVPYSDPGVTRTKITACPGKDCRRHFPLTSVRPSRSGWFCWRKDPVKSSHPVEVAEASSAGGHEDEEEEVVAGVDYRAGGEGARAEADPAED